ncbi:hypothetical protein B7463_g10570, partial [Scytalidium lignicola]
MAHLFKSFKQTYCHLSASDDSTLSPDPQDSPLMGAYSEKPRPIHSSERSMFAIVQASINFLWTIALLLVTVVLLFKRPQEPFREWHETDIESARPFIARTPIKFTTGLYWNDTTGDTTVRVWNEDEPLYVGPRTPDLDAAWDEITLPLDLFITEEEARGIPDIPQGMYRDPKTGNYQVM